MMVGAVSIIQWRIGSAARAAVLHGRHVRVLDPRTGEALVSWTPPPSVEVAQLTCIGVNSSEGNGSCMIAVGTDDGRVLVWNAATAGTDVKTLSDGGKGAIRSVVFHPKDHGTVFTCGDDKQSQRALGNYVVPETDQTIRSTKAGKQGGQSLAISGDGCVLACGTSGGGGLRVWRLQGDAKHEKCLRLAGHVSSTSRLALSHNGCTLAATADRDRFIHVFRLEEAFKRQSKSSKKMSASSMLVSDSVPVDISISPQGDQVVATLEQGDAVIWNDLIACEKPYDPSRTLSDGCLATSFVGEKILLVRGTPLRPIFKLLDLESGDTTTTAAAELLSGAVVTEKAKGIKRKRVHVEDTRSGFIRGKMDDQLLHALQVELEQSAAAGEAQISLIERFKVLREERLPQQLESTPKADSFQTVLTQALQSDDHEMFEYCLRSTSRNAILKTIDRLAAPFVIVLLRRLITKFSSRPNRAAELLPWIRTVLLRHSSYLMTVPDVAQTLSSLYDTCDARLGVYKRFLRLSGRLDLIAAQVSTQGASPETQSDSTHTTHLHFIDSNPDSDADDDAVAESLE